MQFVTYGNPDGPPILFIHGGGVAGWMWQPVIAHLPEYHSIVPDLPGHGASDGSAGFSIADIATALNELLHTYEGTAPITVVGFSVGGQIVLEMLRNSAANITTSIIVSAPARRRPLAGLTASLAAWALPLAKMETFAKLQARDLGVPKHLFAEYFATSKALPKHIFYELMHENLTYELPSEFAQARGNVFVVAGAREPGVVRKTVNDMMRLRPATRGTIIPRMGHNIPFRDPAGFAEMVRVWMGAK